MMRKNLFGTLCVLVVSGVAVAATPRMSLRLRGPHTATEEQWRATYGALAANPGCCDEVWFSTGIGVPPFVGLMVPHVAAATGALRTVALLNTRIDVQGPLTLRLRGVPAGATAVWREMRRAPVPLVLSREGALSRVTIPEIGAWNGGYVDLVEASK